jgi:hypothetical protein
MSEKVEKGGMVEIANIHADFVYIVGKMAGCRKRLGEYSTLSARALKSTRPGPHKFKPQIRWQL